MRCAEPMTFSSSTALANAFHEFQPIGGVGAWPDEYAVQRPAGASGSMSCATATMFVLSAAHAAAANFFMSILPSGCETYHGRTSGQPLAELHRARSLEGV